MLKTQPKHVWKYAANFKRKDKSFIKLKIDDQVFRNSKLLLVLCVSFCIRSSLPTLFTATRHCICVSHFR